jgi:hypothetical protein
MEPSNAPLETPSHNGPYVGTLPVRTLAPGESGEQLSWESDAMERRNRKQKEQARELVRRCFYKRCHKILSPDKKKRFGNYCNHACRDAEKGPAKHRRSTRLRSKWEK